MRFADIPARSLTLRIKRTDASNESIPEGPVYSVSPCPTRPGEFELRVVSGVLFAKPASDADLRRLTAELASAGDYLAQLANPAKDGSVELQIAAFAGECRDMGAVQVGVDEYVERKYAELAQSIRTPSGSLLYDALSRRFSFEHGDSPYFFFFAGPAIDDALHSEPDEGQGDSAEALGSEDEKINGSDAIIEGRGRSVLAVSHSRPEPTRKNSLCIVGDGLRFVATETIRPDGASIYVVTRFTKTDGSDRALRLGKGRLTFCDWTQAGQIQLLTKAQISDLTRDDGSYLKRWNDFVEVEGRMVLAQARKIGAMHYTDAKPERDGTVTVRIEQSSDAALKALAAGEVESVEVAGELPEYLTDPSFTFAQFTEVIEEEQEKKERSGKRGEKRDGAKARYPVIGYAAVTRTLTLKTEMLPSPGTLILSLAGQIAQIKRRLQARRRILQGRSANPQLGLLLEEKGVIAQTRSPSSIKPLTAFVAKKVFRSPPTEKQREAISVALNTPDIALIQGPPGTGKTTVIAAIIERLNEIADKRGGSIKGSILLTGLQHDAVENMIGRLSLNGLPVPKFGTRSGSDEDSFDRSGREIQERCSEWARVLRVKNPSLTEIELETQIKNLSLQYLISPTRALAVTIARRIASISVTIVGEECARRAAILANRLAFEDLLNVDLNPLLEAVRRLRHHYDAFADDGPERASDALETLSDVLSPGDRATLEKASLWSDQDGIAQLLENLAELKKRLIYRFTVPPVFRVEKRNDEVVWLMEEACKRIRIGGISATDVKSAALSEFLTELESNPYGMMDAVSDYAYALAATCQQSVNNKMLEQKGISRNIGSSTSAGIEYEYVIVDEAARLTPPDLMIAMAQGKRIILVGDHRQLPHIIDQEVAEQMEAGETGKNETEWLKQSMFQHLFSTRLKALEEADGISRRVTLDTQYRMHPLLGEFVSRNFYERFDAAERFGSGRPEADFIHSLPGTDGSPAIWLDLPASKGKHSRSRGETSWTRVVESNAIVEHLRTWMTSTAGKDLSFGVISFYKAQAELIKKQLGTLAESEERIRVGTVDSFQGMEFDVVILSMVRTIEDNWQPRSEDETKEARKLFGHLCLYNRLNVSMSRQKKLLVVAGDSGLLRSDLSVKYIPGLVDFYKLCKARGRVLPWR